MKKLDGRRERSNGKDRHRKGEERDREEEGEKERGDGNKKWMDREHLLVCVGTLQIIIGRTSKTLDRVHQ